MHGDVRPDLVVLSNVTDHKRGVSKARQEAVPAPRGLQEIHHQRLNIEPSGSARSYA